LRSVDFAEIEQLQRDGNWDEAGQRLAREAVALQAHGAELLVLCTNTMHKVADAITAAVEIPFVHIADTTAHAVRAEGLSTVGLLATGYTMEQDFYTGRLRDTHGLTVLIPDSPDRRLVHNVIYDELCQGIVDDRSRACSAAPRSTYSSAPPTRQSPFSTPPGYMPNARSSSPSAQATRMLDKYQHERAATFLFADIAGFTALTEAHGDEEAAKLVADRSDAVKAELPAYGAIQVKTIGDALMLHIPEPADAVLLGLQIAYDILRGHGAPAVRVGMHHGTAIERDGDYIGGAVNLAARVSAAATGGEVLLTAQTAALAPDVDAVLYESRGRQTLRNVREPVELVAAIRQGYTTDDRLAVDPVRHMVVGPDHSAGRLVYDGMTYFFCTLTRAGAFARHPERFAQ
jgi:class 3 adenylate cyclase/YHS domain-containing protein